MCWDEFKSVASAMASMVFAYCDAITHQLVNVVQDRKNGEFSSLFHPVSSTNSLKC